MSQTAVNPKAAHYTTVLTAALLRGAWADNSPGAAPNGTELSWGELIRKWGKHTGGNTALIHHLRDISLLYLSSTSHPSTAASGYITVPPPNTSPRIDIAPLSLAEQPGSSNSSASADGASQTTTGSSFVHIPHPHLRHRQKPSLDGASGSGSTIRPPDAAGSTTGVASRAAYLSAGDLDGDEIDDPSAWAEGNEWWHGVSVDAADEVTEGLRALETLVENSKLSLADATSARLTLAYHLHALAAHESALRVFDSISWAGDSRLGVVQGDAAVLERIRGRCLQGLSAELSTFSNPTLALKSYLSIIPLLKSLSSLTFPTPPYLLSQPSSSKLPLDPHRELYRFITTALTRAAVLSARQPSSLQQTLRILRTYYAFSTAWPPTFRPIQRQKLGELYFRALASSYPPPGRPAEQPYHLDGGSSSLSAHALWKREVVEAVRQGRQLLSTTTSFPRAGSVNVKVKTFANLSVALYGKCTALGREVIAVLWWAMTLTFQSQSILRHLTRLLTDVGDSVDARRVFELYVQLVLKARETQQPEISLQLKRRPTDASAASPAQIQQEAEATGPEEEQKRSQSVEAELDSDQDFVITLLGGARLLCRDLGEPEEAWRYACLAGDVLEKRQIGDVLRARVEESKGIIRMAMAAKGADAISRPTYQAQAINHLIAATSIHPTASAFYHLAYCQAEARSIDLATNSIRSSLETDSRNVQSWHLLALLLTAQRDWDGAMKACEAGVTVWEEDEEALIANGIDELESGGAGEALDVNVASKDFAMTPATPTVPRNERNSGFASTSALLRTDGSFPFLSVEPPHITPLSRSSRLEHVIRIRMTLNVIIEKTQGPEAVMLKQQELFAFFSARSGKNRDKLGYTAFKSVHSSGSLTQMATGFNVPGGVDGGRGLEGSYISVPPQGDSGVSVQPPTPIAQSAQPSLIIQSSASTPGNSSPDPVPSDVEIDEKTGNAGSSRRNLAGRTSKRISKHLHVPGHGHGHGHGRSGGSTSASRPSSVRRFTGETVTEKSPIGRHRAFSISSAALSIAPTAVHSHFHNTPQRSPTPLPPPLPVNGTDEHGRTSAESRILSNLWLMSAATFRRWGKMDQSLVAIEEAEVLDPENADVWVQLGLYHVHAASPSSTASTNEANAAGGGTMSQALFSAEAAFVKSLLLLPDHPPAIIGLSKLYLSTNQADLAESLLNQLTQDGGGWDVPEAWYYLGKVVDQQGRRERARECWTFALGLEEGRGVRGWQEVGRWL